MTELTMFNMDKTYEQTLYVLGNGFDKAHGISSGYRDFEAWVRQKGRDELIELMEVFFSNSDSDFWGDIESCLGKYDVDHIADWCNPNVEIDYDHPTQYAASYADAPETDFTPCLSELKELFSEWVDSISLRGIAKKMPLSGLSRYLTFNYLETLEQIYRIPDSQILHIHGKRGDGEYVFGHNVFVEESDVFDEKDLLFETEAKEHIAEAMNELYKDSKHLLSIYSTFFDSLCNIKQVVVKGHSLCEVDMSYFEKVKSCVSPDANWCFYFHDPIKDIAAIEKCVETLGIDKNKWRNIYW